MANGEDIIRDIVGTFSMVIVELGKYLERHGDHFQRRQFATVLRDAATKVPADSANGLMIKTILENIAAELKHENRRAGPLPFPKGKG